jgi:nucleoside-diphosphate-sugar epimerase
LSVLRLFFPFGPNQIDRLIPDLIRRVHSGRAVHITANGEGMRLTPTFVENVVDVIVESLAASWTGTVNVASPEALSIRQIAEAIGKQLGIQPVLEVVDRKPVDIVPDLARLASRFPLDRFIRFEDALRLTIRRDLAGDVDVCSSPAGAR